MLAWVPRPLAPEADLRTSWLATGALTLLGGAALAVMRASASAAALELALLAQTAAATAGFDLRRRLIPDLYVLAVAVAGVLGPLSPGWIASAAGAVTGGALLGGARWAVGRRMGEEAMGLGDVKLAAALGALLGPIPLLWTVAIAAGAGAVIGGFAQLRRGRLRLPFGAFLAPVGVAALWVTAA